MRIERMQWAGMVVSVEGVKVMVDPVYESPSSSFFGTKRDPFFPLIEYGKPDVIAITHLHSDHFDAPSILQDFGSEIPIYIPREAVREVEEKGFKHVTGLTAGQSVKIKGIELLATHSVDGLGDPQVAWIIKGEGKTLLHSGDTLWHGYWWKMRERYGPFDVVCLPINGAIVQEEGLTPSGLPICMVPEQAASAAAILEARTLIPIHYGSFHNPPVYLETPHAVDRLKSALSKTAIQLVQLNSKESLTF
ncbi:MAG TPA: MBL fold metallo-hydrolase [Sporolactobacillaceae bacterium]|nr:MBL fold metallo-hydrolase [Sporolactobacillaceae bacterium]